MKANNYYRRRAAEAEAETGLHQSKSQGRPTTMRPLPPSSKLIIGMLLFLLTCQHQSNYYLVEAHARINSYGGYEDLVVAIGSDVPPIICQQLVQNIQGVFTSASSYLNEATNGKVYFHRITIVLPSHWDRRACDKLLPSSAFTSTASTEAADFIISGEHPVFGHFPFTQQSQGCGKPGDFTSIGHQFIMQYNDSTTAAIHYYRGSGGGSGSGSSGGGGRGAGSLKSMNYISGSGSEFKTAKDGSGLAPDRAIIHEWAKLRYGVFEEKGYPNDPIYPPSFHYESHSGAEKLVTACTNKGLKGSWSSACTTDSSGPDCQFNPSSTENDGVSSSIMSGLQLSSITKFCDGSNHNPGAPTKQNFMCKQKSVSEIMYSHPDFYNITSRFNTNSNNVNVGNGDDDERSSAAGSGGGNNNNNNMNNNNAEFVAPEFVIKQLTPPRYVLLIEETGNMNLRDVWKYLKLAIRKFIKYDLAPATQIGLITVSTHVQILANMTTLDENLRATLAEKLPPYPNLDSISPSNGHGSLGGGNGHGGSGSSGSSIIVGHSSSSNTGGSGLSLRKGISQAINMLKLNGQRVPGSVIILISQGTISSIDFEASLTLLKQEEVAIATIEYPSAGDGKIASLSAGTNSPHFTIRETGVGPMSHMSTYIQLVNAMTDIQRYFSRGIGLKWPILIHQEEFKGDAPSFIESSFSYDSSQSPGEFYIYVPNPIDPKVNQVELISPSGTKYTDKVSKLHDINIIKIDATIDQPGIWRYRIQRLGDSHQSHFVQVVTSGGGGSSSPSLSDDLNVKVFSNVESSRIVNMETSPLILYADVKRGSSPVIGADVVALINGKWSISLLDNGNGDPDVTQGDGIYSKYIIPPSAAHMTNLDITVKVTTSPYRSKYYTRDSTSTLPSSHLNSLNPPTCCGSSFLTTKLSSSSSIGAAHQSSSSSSQAALPLRTMPYNERVVYSYGVKVLNAKDPGSYPPSRIGNLRLLNSYNQMATLGFTSPGDDYDQGLPKEYQIYWNEKSRKGRLSLKESIVETSQAGVLVNFTLSFPAYRIYFISVAAIDREGRKGEFSNIVEVELIPPPTNDGSTGGGGGGSHSNLNNGDGAQETTDSSSGSSNRFSTLELVFIVLGSALFFILVLIAIVLCVYCTRRNSKGMGSTDTNISTISSENNTTKAPIHWSASELLQEHEKRQSIYGGQHHGTQTQPQHPHYPSNYNYPQGVHPHHNISPGSSTRSFQSISEAATALANRKSSLDSIAGGGGGGGGRVRTTTLTDYESCSSDPTVKSIKGATDYNSCSESDQELNYRTLDGYSAMMMPPPPPAYQQQHRYSNGGGGYIPNNQNSIINTSRIPNSNSHHNNMMYHQQQLPHHQQQQQLQYNTASPNNSTATTTSSTNMNHHQGSLTSVNSKRRNITMV